MVVRMAVAVAAELHRTGWAVRLSTRDGRHSKVISGTTLGGETVATLEAAIAGLRALKRHDVVVWLDVRDEFAWEILGDQIPFSAIPLALRDLADEAQRAFTCLCDQDSTVDLVEQDDPEALRAAREAAAPTAAEQLALGMTP
jgi:hypothetical protein